MKNLFFILLLTITLFAFSQKETNNWYFGKRAAISFNLGKPTYLLNSRMDAGAGCATISTPKGRLLFYTDGLQVWDSTHKVMPNGTELKGNTYSTQSALIIPRPDSSNLYYIFTMDATILGNNGCRYSELNMKLNSGLGDITPNKKNILLLSNSSEKLTGVKHSNGKDYWVIAIKYNSDSIYCWQITSSGVSHTPIINKIGIKIIGNQGYLKTSPDGKKIAFASIEDTSALCDFDASTGNISNIWGFETRRAYGLEFSAQAKYLYISLNSWGKIFQYDLKSTSKEEFLNSKKTIDSNYQTIWITLQLAKDGKIYISQLYGKYLDVINEPDVGGLDCKLQKNYVYLYGKTGNLGLPNFISSYFQKMNVNINGNCINNPTSFNIINSNGADSVKWNFGDSISGKDNISNKTTDVFHVYQNFGVYEVSLITFSNNQIDTIKSTISFEKPVADFNVTDVCENKKSFFTNKSSKLSKEQYYKWKFGDGQTSTLESPQHLYEISGISQTYNATLVVKTQYGCSDSIVKAVTINANPKSDFTFTASKNIWNFTPTQSGNTKYRWLFGDGDSAISGTASHNYKDGLSNHKVCLKANNVAGCISETCKQIATTGIYYTKPSGFKIYPNPNTGNFTIEIDNPEKDIFIEVYNSVGGLVKKVKMVEKVTTINLDVAVGIYLVKVRNGEMEYNQKVSITK